jgi:hypothetical protein
MKLKLGYKYRDRSKHIIYILEYDRRRKKFLGVDNKSTGWTDYDANGVFDSKNILNGEGVQHDLVKELGPIAKKKGKK